MGLRLVVRQPRWGTHWKRCGRSCPGLRHRVATEQGEIREHVNVFVRQENMLYTGGLATSVPKNGAEIFDLPRRQRRVESAT